MNLDEIIARRRSYRAYTDYELTSFEIDSILKAAMLAPVAMGQYENILLKVYIGEELKTLQDNLIKFNGKDNTYGAKCLIGVYHKGNNIELLNLDCGCIVENILLKATELDLQSVFIYSILPITRNTKELNKYYSIEDYKLVSMVSIGKAKDKNDVRNIKHKMRIYDKEIK